MKQKTLIIAFLALCLCLCVSLSIGILFTGPGQAGANEQLSELPVLIHPEDGFNKDFLQEVSAWIGDHFFLRQQLITAERRLTAAVFGTSSDPGVILGKEGWLYYADTLPDYTGTDPMTQRQLYAAATNLRLMDSYCRSRGSRFQFVIAPNKNSVYPQYMPAYGAAAQTHDAQRLLELLQQQGTPAADLFALGQEPTALYFAHDSHWNTMGAALGADRINALFGVQSNYYGGDFSQQVPHEGDLYTMLYPAATDPENDYVYGGSLDYTFATSATRPDAIVLSTESDAPGSLLAYRDSFGNNLFPFLADSYGTARFSRSTVYDLTKEADYVLIQLVERNLTYLTENLPVLQALPVALSIPQDSSGSISVQATEKNSLLRLEGQLPAVDDDARIYIVCREACYEAFCMDQAGFGIHLPPDSTPLSVVTTQGGTPVLYEIEIQTQ